MKKMATKKMTYGGAKTMMSKGGKTTAKPKMEKGGATKKKYMVGGATEQCGPDNPNCKQKRTFAQMRSKAPKAKNTTKSFRKG